LPVEQHNIAVSEMSLDYEARLKSFRDNLPVGDEF